MINLCFFFKIIFIIKYCYFFYRIKNTSFSNYTKDDIFDCWLYQNKTWSDLVPISENKNNNWKTSIKSSSTNSISQVTKYVLLFLY